MLRKSSILRVNQDACIVVDKSGQDTICLPDRVAALDDGDLVALQIFAVRRSLASGVRALARFYESRDARGPADALETVWRLYSCGLLIEDRAALVQANLKRGMFGAPLASMSEIRQDDIVVYGMPYDLGVTCQSGAKGGPNYIRAASATAFDYACDQRHLGWWHPYHRAQVLDGVPIRDIGEVDCTESQRNGAAFDRVYQVQQRILELGGLPVMIGGDHSVSLPVISATAAAHPGLVVIQLDAHSDLGPDEDMGDWRRNASHGNFMSWIVQDKRVDRVVQLGVRNLLSDRPYPSEKVQVYAGVDWLSSLENLLEALPRDKPYYLTFDVDVLDPKVISQTGTPVPGGLSYDDAVRVIRGIGSRFDLAGCDFVELQQNQSLLEGSIVSYLCFELLAAQHLRRRQLGQ